MLPIEPADTAVRPDNASEPSNGVSAQPEDAGAPQLETAASPSPQNADAPSPEVPPAAGENKNRIPLLSIPVILSVGLLIAAVYLGARIVSAHKPTHEAVAPVAQPVAQRQTTTPQQAVLPEQAVLPQKTAPVVASAVANIGAEHDDNDAIPMITPHPGDRYIQVAALDRESTRRFVGRLRADKLQPHVAPGPKPELLRVLIGPFDNREALNTEKAQLQNEGLEAFIREY